MSRYITDTYNYYPFVSWTRRYRLIEREKHRNQQPYEHNNHIACTRLRRSYFLSFRVNRNFNRMLRNISRDQVINNEWLTRAVILIYNASKMTYVMYARLPRGDRPFLWRVGKQRSTLAPKWSSYCVWLLFYTFESRNNNLVEFKWERRPTKLVMYILQNDR